MLSRLPCHPLDTMKARLQSDASASAPTYRNFAHGLKLTVQKEGLRGLYRGLWPTVVGSGPASILYYTSYEMSKAFLEPAPVPDELKFFTAGMIAEAFSCVLWVPIDVVKERMQIQRIGTQSGTFYKSGWDAVMQISKGEGLRGLYKGYWATLASFGPFSAFYFMLYERFKSFAQKEVGVDKDSVLPIGWQLATAAAAGGVASWLTNPLDMVKLRLQVQRGDAGSGGVGFRYSGMIDGLRSIIANEGPRGLFKGSGARVLFHASFTMVNMSLFERCKDGVARLLGERA